MWTRLVSGRWPENGDREGQSLKCGEKEWRGDVLFGNLGFFIA